jgi:hypothetical protein
MIQGEGSIVFDVQTKQSFILVYMTLKIVKNEIKLRKLWPPKAEEVKNSKKTNH